MADEDRAFQTLEKAIKHAEETGDQRVHLRVVPAEDNPVTLQLGETTHLIADISEGGVAMDSDPPPAEGSWEAGMVVTGLLSLPEADTPLPVTLEVLGIEEDGLVRFGLRNPSDLLQMMIAAYVAGRVGEIVDGVI